MESKKSYIPVKVFISYIALSALVVAVGWLLYSENMLFSKTENKITVENNKVIKVGNLLSNIYKTESQARLTIQSENEQDFKMYLSQTSALQKEIDSLKSFITNESQVILLDSVKGLLSKKTENIKQLKILKSKANDEAVVKNAINNITRMEGNLRKLKVEDFVKDPAALPEYQKGVLRKYVEYMNQNIPNDSTNTLSQNKLDSVLIASKKLLNNVKKQTAERKEILNSQENKLLQNELSISAQLRKILSVVEREIIINTTKSNVLKENSLRKTNEIVTTAAIIGFLLTVFFSILILNDYSKTQSYKKQLEIANQKTNSLLKNREQLISTVSHDLKTPLSTIIGYTALLNHSDLNDKQNYYTENIKGSSEYISKLVQDLLDFTQIEAGKITIENIPFSLQNLIEETAKSIASVFTQKEIELKMELDPALEKRIISDPFRLRQILSNIIGNAYKFTERGEIAIKTQIISTEKFRITITDSGIGIKKSSQKMIFEEFTQADESIEKHYGGTGLGLTISKKMTEFLGGKLHLESTFGEGSIFEIELPLHFDDTVITENQPRVSTKNSNKTLIVVDDDVSLLKLTSEILKNQNYEVLAFTSAEEALKKIENTSFDCVITDIRMPEMDGFSFVKKLQNGRYPKYKNQPIIAVTGNSDLDLKSYNDAGFTTILKKPYAPKTLLETLENVWNSDSLPDFPTEMKKNTETSYSLDSLKSFFPDDDETFREVLRVFVSDTAENFRILETAITDYDTIKIKETAHRMSSMFLQLKAETIGKMLKDVEYNDYSKPELESFLAELKAKTELLFEKFKADSIL